jgi:hypothetical protein
LNVVLGGTITDVHVREIIVQYLQWEKGPFNLWQKTVMAVDLPDEIDQVIARPHSLHEGKTLADTCVLARMVRSVSLTSALITANGFGTHKIAFSEHHMSDNLLGMTTDSDYWYLLTTEIPLETTNITQEQQDKMMVEGARKPTVHEVVVGCFTTLVFMGIQLYAEDTLALMTRAIEHHEDGVVEIGRFLDDGKGCKRLQVTVNDRPKEFLRGVAPVMWRSQKSGTTESAMSD